MPKPSPQTQTFPLDLTKDEVTILKYVVAGLEYADEPREAYHENLPAELAFGQWHLPLIDAEDVVTISRGTPGCAYADPDGWDRAYRARLCQVSTGRCARVSYLTHDGIRAPSEDIALHDRLLAGAATGDPMHMSPFEHPCVASAPGQRVGPFTGWTQYRKLVIGEAGPSTHDKCRRCGCWGGRHVATCPKRPAAAVR